MSVHSLHADTHEHGLADDCDRCTELAKDPFRNLDETNLRNLYARTTRWMNDDPHDALPRSENELTAMRVMEQAILRARLLDRISTGAEA